MKMVLIINDSPYGTERCYNALRLAHALLKEDADLKTSMFLMAGAVAAGRAGQKPQFTILAGVDRVGADRMRLVR